MSVVLVLDCGATNIRAIAVSEQGKVVASHYIKNNTQADGKYSQFQVWDFEEIWHKLKTCCHNVVAQLDGIEVSGITVTTFGVDGAPFDAQGRQLYPIISWKCARTVPVMAQIAKEIDRLTLYRRNGVGDYSFNTLYKLAWLKHHEREVFEGMDRFVFISSMISKKLTGRWTTDRTMAGTSMLTELDSGEWDQDILDYLGLNPSQFPPMVNAGDKVGSLQEDVSFELGLPAGTPVLSTGHDTQFALIGSGASENQAFLSSGTWEILMARSTKPELDHQALLKGVTVELDAVSGICNPAIQWLSSAVVEWVVNQFYGSETHRSDLYQVMISEATEAGPGAGGVRVIPDFSADLHGINQGTIQGLSIHTTRGQIFRAVLEALSEKLKGNFDYFSSKCQLDDGPIIVVGGGAKNSLWNQLRADALQRPLHIVEQAEATVVGAAMVTFYGVGVFNTIQEAQTAMKAKVKIVAPSSQVSASKPESIYV